LLKIGITGGIGSGKTTVSSIFEVLGIPVYYADVEAKKIINEDDSIITSIKKIFGEESYINHQLNSKHIASIVFTDPNKLNSLNQLVHPATISHANDWMYKQTSPYCIKEAALIFESDSQKNLDYVIGVWAQEDIRIKRIIQRDRLTKDEVLKRINNQMNEELKMKNCDFIILNNDVEMLTTQVIELHEKLLSMSLLT
jgi:dephospho-CoA kinase